MIKRAKSYLKLSLIPLLYFLTCDVAFALPWEAPLKAIRTSLTGPVAKAIGVIAMAIAGGMLAFGGELSEFAKRICMVVLALAVLLLANGLVTTLFGV